MYTRGIENIPTVVKNLLIINIMLFAISNLLPGLNLYEYFVAYYWGSSKFKPFQIITHMFMHAGFMHLLFNMFALWMFGSTIERVWGSTRFLNFYLICGLGSFALHYIIIHFEVLGMAELYGNWEEIKKIAHFPTLGASGAISGILVAFAMMYPDAKLFLIFFPIPIKAKYFVPLLFLFEFFIARQNLPKDNIAHYAHLGGAIIGFLLVLYWKKKKDI